jgi:hypothetical protein
LYLKITLLLTAEIIKRVSENAWYLKYTNRDTGKNIFFKKHCSAYPVIIL